MKLLWMCLLLALMILPAQTGASERPRAFLDGVQAYRDGDYDHAIERFSAIVNAGIRNGKLYYNLANAHMKKGELGRAILWYERAARLIPDDPDLAFNRDFAASLVQDASEEKDTGIVQVLFFWYFILSAETIRWTAVILNAVFWAMLAARRMAGKQTLNSLGLAVAALTLVLSLTAGVQYWQARHVRAGIVIPAQVSVRSGLSESATELFVLHAGTRTRIEQEREEGYRIRFSENKIGWVKRADLEAV
ncbi:MAG: tetratricopeptide repeat protein [Desulfobacterales bacterium]|nr:tetratricopeptide repeat protein [Desulfobacterales bacterium]